MAVLDALIEQRARDAVAILEQHARVRAAYIFGSQAEGQADATSDVDIAVFVEGLEDWDLRRRARTSALIQKQAGDDLELHFFPADLLPSPPPASFAAYILRNGVPLEVSRKAI
jgi:predicted nucleotidyltransferase